jgi:hypothetical protein
MAAMTKVTYSLNICFSLITFKANNVDLHLFLETFLLTVLLGTS